MKTKWNLTKSEQRAYSENAERLKSGGVAIGLEKTAPSELPLVKIEQSEYSFIQAGARKGIALAACVSLMALKSGITICDYEITIPGYDGARILLVPIREGSPSYKALEYFDIEKGAVLNHLILNRRPLPRNRMFDGILVAQSSGSLPGEFQTRGVVNATICLFDQFHNPYPCVLEFIFERDEQGWERAKKEDGLYAPKRTLGTRHPDRVHIHPASAVGKTVSAVKDNAGDRV